MIHGSMYLYGYPHPGEQTRTRDEPQRHSSLYEARSGIGRPFKSKDVARMEAGALSVGTPKTDTQAYYATHRSSAACQARKDA